MHCNAQQNAYHNKGCKGGGNYMGILTLTFETLTSFGQERGLRKECIQGQSFG